MASGRSVVSRMRFYCCGPSWIFAGRRGECVAGELAPATGGDSPVSEAGCYRRLGASRGEDLSARRSTSARFGHCDQAGHCGGEIPGSLFGSCCGGIHQENGALSQRIRVGPDASVGAGSAASPLDLGCLWHNLASLSVDRDGRLLVYNERERTILF